MESLSKSEIVMLTVGLLITFFVVFGLSLVISNKLIGSAIKDADYYQTMRVANNKDDFDYLLNTGAGRTGINNAKICTIDEVTINGLTKKYAYVRSTREDYNLHTYTTSDSKGHVTVHHYWSWDYGGSKEASAKWIKINGVKTKADYLDNPTKNLKLTNENTDLSHIDGWFGGHDPWIGSNGYYLYTDGHTRFHFIYTPLTYKTTIFAKLIDDKVLPLDKTTKIATYTQTVKQVRNDKSAKAGQLMKFQYPISIILGIICAIVVGYLIFVNY